MTPSADGVRGTYPFRLEKLVGCRLWVVGVSHNPCPTAYNLTGGKRA